MKILKIRDLKPGESMNHKEVGVPDALIKMLEHLAMIDAARAFRDRTDITLIRVNVSVSVAVDEVDKETDYIQAGRDMDAGEVVQAKRDRSKKVD